MQKEEYHILFKIFLQSNCITVAFERYYQNIQIAKLASAVNKLTEIDFKPITTHNGQKQPDNYGTINHRS